MSPAPSAAKKDEAPPPPPPTLSTPESVVVHPLVLLSVVDHYNRVAKGTKKRVVGVLLGQQDAANKRVNVANSYAGRQARP